MKAKGIVNEFWNEKEPEGKPNEMITLFEEHNKKLYNDKLKRLNIIATYAMNNVWYKYIHGELNVR